jgi:TRAP-type C4-dicarboxylate transport system substrate-binding protein
MKRVILRSSMAILFLGTLMVSAAFGQEKQILIRYTHQHPTHMSFHKGGEVFCKYVEQKSNGRVKFEMYPASQLYKASETIKAVTSGAVEMGHVTMDEFGTHFPMGYITYQPFLIDSDEARLSVTKGKVAAIFEKEAARVGGKIMFYMPHDKGCWIGNNKRPLKVLKDFDGVLIRTTPGQVPILEALGAKGVRMNVDEVYMAMQRGTVDGCLSSPSSATDRKWEDVTKYSTILDLVAVYNTALMNMNFWNKLPADIQKIMLEGNLEAEKFVQKMAKEKEDEALEILKKKTQLYVLPPDEASKWEKATTGVIDNYVKKGGPIVKEAVEELYRIKKANKK